MVLGVLLADRRGDSPALERWSLRRLLQGTVPRHHGPPDGGFGRVVGMDTGPCPVDGWGNGSELATAARWRRSGAGQSGAAVHRDHEGQAGERAQR
jgi:hypothetical protein